MPDDIPLVEFRGDIARGLCRDSTDVNEVVSRITEEYARSVGALEQAFRRFVEQWQPQFPTTDELNTFRTGVIALVEGACYPLLVARPRHFARSFSIKPHEDQLSQFYFGIEVTQPDIFRKYLIRWLRDILLPESGRRSRQERGKEAYVYVGKGSTLIPLTFGLSEAVIHQGLQKLADRLQVGQDNEMQIRINHEIQNLFALPNLLDIDDSIVDASYKSRTINRRKFRMRPTLLADHLEQKHLSTQSGNGKFIDKPLAPFSALRTDYSLRRLEHYTHTDAKDFQDYILLTNYNKYVENFLETLADDLVSSDKGTIILPGQKGEKKIVRREELDGLRMSLGDMSKRNAAQMPAYHFIPAHGVDHPGVTLVNIGVGPSNAKTITDHLAVLRPIAWLMLGHCGGLRMSQELGQYVLAQAYVRDDHAMDYGVPTAVPVPAVLEVQEALEDAVATVLRSEFDQQRQREQWSEGQADAEWRRFLARHLRTGTIVTTDDRNWELRPFDELLKWFENTRAIAIDMESATVAANGLRYRIAYGTLLCVSDKPLYGELKMRGMADQFYQASTRRHLRVGLEAVRNLWKREEQIITSRKLNGLDDPPLR